MFEDKTPSKNQTNIPPTDKSEPEAKDKPIDQTPASAKSTASPTPDKKLNQGQETEDIFDQIDPVKEPASKSSPIPETSQQEKVSVPSTPARVEEPEPSLKTPPSVFAKKTGAPPTQEPAIPTPTSPTMAAPEIPKPPLNKRNLILLIVILLIVGGAISAAIWWFRGRQTSPDSTTPSALNLFDEESQEPIQEEEPGISIPSQEPQEATPPVSELADTDGDGLSDEEEIFLGTSLNSADTDNDGLYDKEEVKTYNTDPLLADTDNDGWTDGQEIKNHTDPLVVDPGPNTYFNTQFKVRFSYLDNMVLESETANILQFNDNINQIKLYIYLADSQPSQLTPDISYQISEDENGQLIIVDSQAHTDQTPSSTDLSTLSYDSQNGFSYLIRYVATQRASDHQEKFKQILTSFKFLK